MNTKRHSKILAFSSALTVLSLAGCGTGNDNAADKAVAAFKARDYEAAQTAFQQARSEEPANAQLIMGSGRNAMVLGNTELAASEFEKLLTNSQYKDMASALLAKAKLTSGNPKLAKEILQKYTVSNDVAAATDVMAGLMLGEGEKAVSKLDGYMAKYPNSRELLILKGTLAGSLGDVKGAENIAKTLLNRWPDEPDTLLYAGRLAIAQRDTKSADAHFSKLLKMVPHSDIGLVAKATIELDRGNKKGAEELLAKALSHNAGNIPARYLMAEAAIKAGNYEAATAALRGLDKAYEIMPGIALLNALVEAHRNNHESAVIQLRRYFQNGGDEMRARLAMARSLALTKREAEAWTYLKPVADAANADPAVLAFAVQLAGKVKDQTQGRYAARLAALQTKDPIAKPMVAAENAMRRGDWKAADALYTPLLAANDRNIVLLNNAAYVRIQLGQFDGAVALAQKAYGLAPNDPVVADTLGWALFNRDGASTQALAMLRQALNARPNNTEFRSHMTRALASTRTKSS